MLTHTISTLTSTRIERTYPVAPTSQQPVLRLPGAFAKPRTRDRSMTCVLHDELLPRRKAFGRTHNNAIQNKSLNRVKTAFDYESVVVDAIKEQPGPAYLVWTNCNETTDKSCDINDEFLENSGCQKMVRCSEGGRRTPVARHNKVHDAMIIQ